LKSYEEVDVSLLLKFQSFPREDGRR